MSEAAAPRRSLAESALEAIPLNAMAWVVLFAAAAIILITAPLAPWLDLYPANWALPVDSWIRVATDWVVATFRPIFRGISWLLNFPMAWLQAALGWLPWSVTTALFVLTAWRATGPGTALFTGLAFLYIAVVGYWVESMNTLALVGVSIPLSAALGFGLGVLGHRSAVFRRILAPTLDFMQTVPAFAYLTPILLMFGFGPVVGLIASAIFAAPPMVRNTMLGLTRVPQDVKDAALMCGCTGWQRFWQAEVPSAKAQLLVGLNQTTMAALSMVIIAAIIGGFDDIGWEVLSVMRKAQFGQSLLAGIVIALLAMVLERISAGFAGRRSARRGPLARLTGLQFVGVLVAAVVLGALVSWMIPALWSWPNEWRFFPAKALNDALSAFLVDYGAAMKELKNAVLFYFLLPIKLGLSKAVAPFTFGFALTPAMKVGYLVLAVGLTCLVTWRVSWRAGVATGLIAGLLWYGTTGTPWLIFIAATTLLAWQLGGAKAGGFVLGALLFILLSGVWDKAMLSVYLCGAAVMISVLLGAAIGVWAAASATVSAILRPINDTLQTMPQFVLLIPALMLFQVGEFTALLAVIAYAIVPAIRYTEAGIRNVRPELLEAARAMGCSPWQVFWRVKLPQALPEILLGVNQTILFGFAMLAIAALVGTTGLGQAMYLGLSKADAGMALVAGLSMALLAMIADRILSAMARRRTDALGIL